MHSIMGPVVDWNLSRSDASSRSYASGTHFIWSMTSMGCLQHLTELEAMPIGSSRWLALRTCRRNGAPG